MAFGIEVIGKLFLSVFRIVAVLFIGYYLYKLVKEIINSVLLPVYLWFSRGRWEI